jgi:hypothetical protein
MSFLSTESLAQRNRIIDTHRQLILDIRRVEPEISRLGRRSRPALAGT